VEASEGKRVGGSAWPPPWRSPRSREPRACGEPEGGDGDGGDGDGDSCDISTVIEVDLETGEATIGPSLGRYVSSAYGAGEDIWALTDDRLHRVTADGLGDPVGSRAAFVSLGDLDSDGDLDAVTSITSTSGGSSFTVVAREGDALDQVETESVAANATHVALADANDDGHLDVLALVDGYLRLHTGDGQLNFELASDPGVGGDNTDWVSAGDVNGDGAIDVVAAISPIGTPSGEPDEVFLSVWVGEGDGTFAEPTRIVLGERFLTGTRAGSSMSTPTASSTSSCASRSAFSSLAATARPALRHFGSSPPISDGRPPETSCRASSGGPARTAVRRGDVMLTFPRPLAEERPQQGGASWQTSISKSGMRPATRRCRSRSPTTSRSTASCWCSPTSCTCRATLPTAS
jgi:hypothetical protein